MVYKERRVRSIQATLAGAQAELEEAADRYADAREELRVANEKYTEEATAEQGGKEEEAIAQEQEAQASCDFEVAADLLEDPRDVAPSGPGTTCWRRPTGTASAGTTWEGPCRGAKKGKEARREEAAGAGQQEEGPTPGNKEEEQEGAVAEPAGHRVRKGLPPPRSPGTAPTEALGEAIGHPELRGSGPEEEEAEVGSKGDVNPTTLPRGDASMRGDAREGRRAKEEEA